MEKTFSSKRTIAGMYLACSRTIVKGASQPQSGFVTNAYHLGTICSCAIGNWRILVFSYDKYHTI